MPVAARADAKARTSSSASGRSAHCRAERVKIWTAWQPSDRELGNDGGHYGAYQPDYLKVRVLPVLLGS